MSPTAKQVRRFGDERGFSVVQLIIVVAITGVLAGMAVFGMRSARSTVKLNNAARDFAQYAEKARLDAIRRRTTTHIEFTGPSTFEVTMDFTGDGISETRRFTLDDGVVLTDSDGNAVTSSSSNLPYADFDWRGRTYQCNALFPFKNTRSEQLTVQVAGSGDITVNSSITGLPTVSYTNVNASSDVNPSASLTGTDTKLNLSPCSTVSATPTPTGTGTPTPTPTPTATPTPSGTPTPTPTASPTATPTPDPPCSLTADSTSLSVQRKSGSTAALRITVNQPGTIVKTVDSNLNATTSSSETVTSSGGATLIYSVTSPANTWNTSFPIKFEFANCSPVTVNVSVTK